MAEYMREHHDKVIGRWGEYVVAGVRGRISAEEVQRELEGLYSLLLRTMSDQDEHAAGELHATLDDLSRTRALNAFSPTETAQGVFSLKDVVYELVADSADIGVRVPEVLPHGR
jgi:rsbT co-antagonist protein RsbR